MANSEFSRKLISYFLRPVSTIFLLFIFGSTSHTFSQDGPGLGNLTYTPSENYTRISPLFDDTTGFLPSDRTDDGINMTTMLNGYMIGVFSPDAPGFFQGGFIAVDVSDPRNVSLVTTVYEPDVSNSNRTGDGERTREFREVHSLGLSTNSLMAIQTGKGIEIWDWSDVNNPIQRSKLPIPGVNYGDYDDVSWQLFWQAPYLYVSRGGAGLTIVNTSDVDNPTLVKTIDTSVLGNFSIGPLFAMGNEMFISSMQTSAGFSILDISDPENPSLLKTIPSVEKFYYASCWDGKKAVFSTRGIGEEMAVYDTTVSPMTIINDSLPLNDSLYCSMQDNFVFSGNQNDIEKINISNPANYNIVGNAVINGTSSNTDHGQVFPFGNLVWVGNDHGTGSGFIAHQTAPDTTAPSIVTSDPAEGDTNQPLSTRIGISFSDSILMESVNASTFRVRALGTTGDIAGTYSVNLGIINFHPTNPLAVNTTYEVTVDGVQDFVGNAISQNTFRFSTGASIGQNISITSSGPTHPNQSVSFTAQSSSTSGGTFEYSWDFGDGTTSPFSTNENTSHIYNSAGHWIVVVTVREGVQQTTGGFTQTIYNPLTAVQPTRSKTIIFDGTRAINVNEDNDTVTAISGVAAYAKLWEITVGDRPRTLAKAPNGNIWVVNQGSDSITVLNPNTGAELVTYNLPRGSSPYGIAFSPDGSNAYVTLEALGKLIKIDLTTGVQIGEVTVGDSARGIAIDGASNFAYVTRFISPQTHAEVIEVNISSMTINNTIQLQKDITTIDSGDRSRGLPNYLNSITIAPDGNRAWVPSNKTNVDRGEFNENDPAKKLTFDTTVRAIQSQIDLSSKSELFSDQIDFDNRSQPKDTEFTPLGDYVMTALEGHNSVEILSAYNGTRAKEITGTGKAPRGLALNGNILFVHNFTSRTVSVYDLTPFLDNAGEIVSIESISTVANEALNDRVLAGKQIFYDASDPRMSKEGYLSCASCHTGGDSDNRVWDFTDRGEGLRNTISLLGRHGMGNGRVHWTANFDEIQDFENDIRGGFNGKGFLSDSDFNATQNPLGASKAGKSVDLDNLALFVQSLNEFPKSATRTSGGDLTTDAVAGQSLFSSKGCASCHSGDFFTDNLKHDVGTIQLSSGQGISQSLPGVGFDTPTLIGVWQTPPYFHNGQAATLDDVLQTGTEHTVSNGTERSQLIAYLQQIEYEGSATGGTPGLKYGTLPGDINLIDPNPETSITTNLSETEDFIDDDTTEVYTGFIFDADGNISFTEHIDDRTRLYIDGNLVLTSDDWSDRVSTNNLFLTAGWHEFELRISNGNVGSGPVSSPGFGFDPSGGTNWVHPTDPGDGSLFQNTDPGTTPPPPTNQYQYVRLNATSELNSNEWATAAELKFYAGSTQITTLTVHGFNSEETTGEGANNGHAIHAIDGNTGTFWHTKWYGYSDTYPHNIDINLGSSVAVNELRYTPRQDSANGRIGNYKVYVSTDGTSWTLKTSGSFVAGTAEQTVTWTP